MQGVKQNRIELISTHCRMLQQAVPLRAPKFTSRRRSRISQGRNQNELLKRRNMPKLAELRGTKAIRAQIAPQRVEVAFSLYRPGAREIFLCGDFNQWSPTSLRMIRHAARDHWTKRLILPPGRYHYKFVVDGEWVHNPEASENVGNHHGSLNSVMEVRE